LDKIDVAFQKSEEALLVAKSNFENEYYSASINRSYYGGTVKNLTEMKIFRYYYFFY
jgi:hypothetical protein